MYAINRILYFYVTSLFLVGSLAAQETNKNSFLEIPAQLYPDVSFWIRIYSDVSTQRGLIHDSENLNIVYYETSDNRVQIENYTKELIEDLNFLAENTDKKKLSSQQIRILEIWGENTNKSEFKKD